MARAKDTRIAPVSKLGRTEPHDLCSVGFNQDRGSHVGVAGANVCRVFDSFEREVMFRQLGLDARCFHHHNAFANDGFCEAEGGQSENPSHFRHLHGYCHPHVLSVDICAERPARGGIFDVYAKSDATALDGTKYQD